MSQLFAIGVVKKITEGKTKKGGNHFEIKLLDEKEFDVIVVHSYEEEKPKFELNKPAQVPVRAVQMGNDIALIIDNK